MGVLVHELGLTVWVLAAARLLGMFGVHALLVRAVGLSWWALAGGLAIALAGVVSGTPAVVAGTPAGSELTGPAWWLAVALEAGLGAVLGTWVSLAAGAVEAAAGLARPGLANAAPTGSVDGVDAGLGTLLAAASVVAAFGLGLHHVVLAAAAETFVDWPLLDPLAWTGHVDEALGPALARRIHAITVLALGLSAPWWLTRVVISVGAGLVSGAVPVFEAARRGVEPTLVAAVGLLALFASLGAYPWVWGRALGS